MLKQSPCYVEKSQLSKLTVPFSGVSVVTHFNGKSDLSNINGGHKCIDLTELQNKKSGQSTSSYFRNSKSAR
ncbi:hypothetical protein AV530_007739 [Patagioenas fasciata monilis]|uniref:Uncharacterized protein n=1 Tax=Patagioenas fasciata monilis TaxID=372326 RepID=A0A1V4K0J9_PATFA|nr:hypothetical protein AV530_007739 [Patagioenas fasciata monilis]